MKPVQELSKKHLGKESKYKSLFTKPLSNIEKYNQVSKILKSLSNCYNCYIREYCPKFKTMTDRQKTVGCSDMREIWKFELRKYSNPVDYVILDELARIDVIMRVQELQDGQQNQPLSQSMMRLKHLKATYLEMILKHYKPKEIKHEHKFDFGTGKIKIDKTAYAEEVAEGDESE